ISNTPPKASFTSRNISLPLGTQKKLTCWNAGRHGWQKDGKYLNFHGRYYYLISRARHSDAGTYTCTVRNSAGSITIYYHVNIEGPPVITKADDVVAVEHSNVSLTCNIQSDPPVNITWLHNNIAISQNTILRRGTQRLPNIALQIVGVSKSDSGKYTCEARNIYGRQIQAIALRIIEEPLFEIGVKNHELQYGETATLRCKPLTSDSSMKIFWRKNGKALEMNDRISVSNRNELVIKNVSQEDCGEYYCVVKNDRSVITSFGTLAIKDDPPCIFTPPQNLSLTVGMYARFYCKAAGSPEPVIWWQNRSDTLSDVYEIQNVSISDTGLYICFARSGRKISKAGAFLNVGKPNAVSPTGKGNPENKTAVSPTEKENPENKTDVAEEIIKKWNYILLRLQEAKEPTQNCTFCTGQFGSKR
ncbi:Hemicentin-2, partial [Paramuricea clavata]